MKEEKGCLTETEIGGYIEDRLPEHDRKAIEAHLKRCPDCRKQVVVATGVLTGAAPVGDVVPEYVVQNAIDYYEEKETTFDIILRLVQDTVRVIRSAADVALAIPQPLAALRNVKAFSPTLVVLTKSFQSVDVECDIERVSPERCNIKVIALDPADPTKRMTLRNLRVELLCKDRQLASSSMGNNNDVLFEDVSKERYSIRVLQKGETLGELAL